MRGLAFALGVLFAPVVGAFAAPPPVVIFFTSWSGLLDPAAEAAIQSAAAAARGTSGLVRVTGYADTTGSTAANNLLSQLRGQLVRDELVADGVPAERIKVDWKGPTESVGMLMESRRVMIQFE